MSEPEPDDRSDVLLEADEPPVMLSLLLWQDTRTSRERELEAPQKWRSVPGFLAADAVLSFCEDESVDTPGTLVQTCDGGEYRTAATLDTFRRAYVEATGVRIVEVG